MKVEIWLYTIPDNIHGKVIAWEGLSTVLLKFVLCLSEQNFNLKHNFAR